MVVARRLVRQPVRRTVTRKCRFGSWPEGTRCRKPPTLSFDPQRRAPPPCGLFTLHREDVVEGGVVEAVADDAVVAWVRSGSNCPMVGKRLGGVYRLQTRCSIAFVEVGNEAWMRDSVEVVVAEAVEGDQDGKGLAGSDAGKTFSRRRPP